MWSTTDSISIMPGYVLTTLHSTPLHPAVSVSTAHTYDTPLSLSLLTLDRSSCAATRNKTCGMGVTRLAAVIDTSVCVCVCTQYGRVLLLLFLRTLVLLTERSGLDPGWSVFNPVLPLFPITLSLFLLLLLRSLSQSLLSDYERM